MALKVTRLSEVNDSNEENSIKIIKESILRERIDRIDKLNNIRKQYLSDYYIIVYGKNEVELESTAVNVATEITKCGIGTQLLNMRDTAVFLKYSFSRNFDEREIKDLKDGNLLAWVKPKEIVFRANKYKIDGTEAAVLAISDYPLIVTREVCRFARNTVDTLVTTRELKEYGVEVFFVEDNIWTMDGDGELRLSLMATLAQEESRKTSERVRAGQKISRDNGVLYGSGNIIGYDRDKAKGTYVINPEQAETVRIIFDLYSKGYGEKKITTELCRLKRKDGVGKVSWSCSKISRILRNATYKGYKVYLKSFCNNYLDQKRIKNLDEDTYLYIKGDFEPIVSEELWDYCRDLRKSRTQTWTMKSGQIKGLGVKPTDDVFLHKLRCSCGAKLRKNRWHQRKDGSWSYGYRCYRAINNGSKAFREQNGLDTEGYCNGPMICDWKFDIMAVTLFNRLWQERGEAIIEAYNILNRNYMDESSVSKETIAGIEGKLERAKNRLSNFICMRADGEISKDEYSEMKSRCEAEIEKLQKELTSITESDTVETRKVFDIDKIKARLQQLTAYNEGKVPSEIIEAFVAAIIPEDDGKHFSWYLTLDDDEYHQSFCTLEGRKNTLRLDVQTVEDEEGALPTFFHNQYFAEAEQIGKNPFQRGVLHRLI